jgi:hypothetical protein
MFILICVHCCHRRQDGRRATAEALGVGVAVYTYASVQTPRELARCDGFLIKLPPLMPALSTVILARLLVGNFDGLEHLGVLTLRTGLPPSVCGFAMDGRHNIV